MGPVIVSNFDAIAEKVPVVVQKTGGGKDLTPEVGFLLSQLDGRIKVAELQHLVPFSPGEIADTLNRLHREGWIEWRDGYKEAETPREAPEPSRDEPEEVARLRRRLRLQRSIHDKGDAFAALGLKGGATDDDVRDAWHRLSRQFHPDRYYNIELPDDLKQELEALYGEMQQWYQQLATREKRRDYLLKQRNKRTARAEDDKSDEDAPKAAGPERLAGLAEEAVSKGQYDAAITNYRLANSMKPGGGYGEKAKLVELLQKLDKRLHELETGDEAPDEMTITSLEDMIRRIQPVLPPVAGLLKKISGFLLAHGEDTKLAQDNYQRLRQLNRMPDTLILGAKIYLKAGLGQTALDLLEEAREQDPKHPELKECIRQAKRLS